MGLYEREYMKQWRRKFYWGIKEDAYSNPATKPPKPLSYWITRLIVLLATLELAFILARFFR
jgi:hypothetical protein